MKAFEGKRSSTDSKKFSTVFPFFGRKNLWKKWKSLWITQRQAFAEYTPLKPLKFRGVFFVKGFSKKRQSFFEKKNVAISGLSRHSFF
jgi:hypothetical protein